MSEFETSRSSSDVWVNEPSHWESVALTRWGRILDYGCGEGRWSRLLHSLGWQPICADMDPIALEKCRRRNPSFDCRLMERSAKELPSEDRAVQMILCVEVRSVLESSWFLSEARRVLADDGLLVGVFYNRFSLRGIYRHHADQRANRQG